MGALGNWITNNTESPFMARRTFTVSKPVESAEVNICGLGQFILSINGDKVGDHELDPGWTDYRKVIEYVTFDVSDCLVLGENCIAAEVGNGWYIMNNDHYTFTLPDFMPPNPNPYMPFGTSLILAVKLSINYSDGSNETIYANEDWKTAPHYCIQSNVYGSETFDGRLRQKDWNIAGFDDSSWEQASVLSGEDEPKAELIEQFQPPVKVIRTYEGKAIGHVNNRTIYDFGQNMSGMLTLTARGKKGDVVKVFPAEKLTQDGDVDQVMKGWTTLDSVITFILGEDDMPETFRMKFTYFAGKVAAVETSATEVEIIDLSADAISSAWKTDGTFTSDNERFNKIYDMIERTVEANMVSVHTDCPTIERFAWQEPNHLMAPSIMFMKDGSRLWDKFLMDMRVAQHTAEDLFRDYEGNEFPAGDGLMPSQCPCYIPNVIPVPGMGSFYDIIPWGSTSILGTRWHYSFYGDISIIEKNYDAGMRYLGYLKTKVNENGFINHGLGDWGNPENELARENIETAFLYADTVALQEFAIILGKTDDAEELAGYAESVRDNYNARLLYKDKEGHFFYRSFEHGNENVMTQAVEALPLYFGIVPEEAEADVANAFRRTLEKKQCFSAGEVGMPYIIQTAAKYGMNELVSSFITREEHPSYYAFILDGMTTLGEYWETNPRSHCHDMMGHIIEWYYHDLAGIQPVKPGFEEILIKPYLPEKMHFFSCTYDSVQGKIGVMLKEDDKEIHLTITVPDGVTYTLDTSNLSNKEKRIVF